jgi:hypothetical protein
MKIEELVTSHPEEIKAYIVPIFDALIPRLSDMNSKVNVSALKSVARILSTFGDVIDPVLDQTLKALMNAVSSGNSLIRSAGQSAVHSLSKSVDSLQLLVPLSNIVQFGNPRFLTPALKMLTLITQDVAEKKSSRLYRNILPAALAQVKSGKPDVRSAAEELVVKIHRLAGSSFWENTSQLSSSQQMLLRNIIS